MIVLNNKPSENMLFFSGNTSIKIISFYKGVRK